MNLLLVSFSVNGAMGDNFKMIADDISQYANVNILTNDKISFSKIEKSDIYRVRFDRKRIWDFLNPFSYRTIYKLIRSSRYDAIFVYSQHPVNLFVMQFANSKKIVSFIHDYIMHSGVNGVEKALFSKINSITFKKSGKIIVSCNFIKNELIRLSMIKDKTKVCVNYLGLLDNLIFPMLHVGEDIDVLFFGRIEYYKGLDDLVEISRMLPQYSFYILGRGNLDEIYSKEIHLPGNCQRIDQYVPDDELTRYIQRSKVVVLPYKDATGTQVIQSVFYYSKPIVATNVGCFPEYIGDGDGGVIVPQGDYSAMADALDDLLSNPCKRQQMGKNGHKRLGTIFSKERIVKTYLDIFNSVI